MWYLDRISLTPFDERYMSVPFEFMEYSYVRYMSKPGYEDIRDDYLYKIAKEKELQTEKEEMEAQKELLLGSYTEKETENILNAFAEVQLQGKQ